MRGPGLGGTPGSRLLEEPPHPLLRGLPGGRRRLTARDCVEMLPRARTAARLPQWTRPGAPGWTHALARGSRGEAFKRRWLPGASVENDTKMLCRRTRPSLVAPGRNGGLGRAPSGGSRARARVCGPRWLPPPSTGHVRPPVHTGAQRADAPSRPHPQNGDARGDRWGRPAGALLRVCVLTSRVATGPAPRRPR